jgi:hypothetical protein
MPEITETAVPAGPAQPPQFQLPKGDDLLKISFAELEDCAANHRADYENLLVGIVKQAKKQADLKESGKELTKELTSAANFQGKVLTIELRLFKEAMAKGAIRSGRSFKDHVTGQYGEMPARAYSCANVFGTFVLAPVEAPRYVPEKVYDNQTSRAINAASKVINIAEDIKGATPETCGLNHQVFTDVATVLKLPGGKTSVEALESILSRLVWIESNAGGKTTRTLVYLTEKELADRVAAVAAQDQDGEVFKILKAGGLKTVLTILSCLATQTHEAGEAQELVLFAATLGGKLAENMTEVLFDGKTVKVRRFPAETIAEWHEAVLPTVDFVDLPKEEQAAKYQEALQLTAVYEEMNPEQPVQPVTENRRRKKKDTQKLPETAAV